MRFRIFFAVNRQFNEHGIRFESAIPLLFEEWDGGYKSESRAEKLYCAYDAYDHHWSGTIAARAQYPYGKDERQRHSVAQSAVISAKWRHVARITGHPELLESILKDELMQKCRLAWVVVWTQPEKQQKLYRHFPDDPKACAYGWLCFRE